MGLIDLIKYLPNIQKSKILGKETTRIIRYSFVDNDTEALEDSILNSALALYAGVNLVNKPNNREMLIEYLPINNLKSLGFEGTESDIYDNAITTYKNDLKRFLADFEIEDLYQKIDVVDNREPKEYVIPVYGECNGKSAFPHPYQLRLKKELLEHLRAPRNYNTNKTLVTMPTGAGKTVLAMETIIDLIRAWTSKEPLNICWLVNSKELAEQSLLSFQKLWKQKGDRKIMAQRFFDSFNDLDNTNVDKITFATFQLLTPRLLDNHDKELNFISKLNYLFIDEAHFTGAEQYGQVFQIYQDSSPNPKVVGLTATPIRANDDEWTSLRGLFNNYLRLKDADGVIVDSPIEYLQNRSYLSKLNFNVLNQAIESNQSKKNNMSGYYKSLHESVYTICQNLIESELNTIVFAESKSHAIALSLYLRSRGVENELIVGETPIANRKLYIRRLGDREDSLNIIVNERILSTGIDVPGLNSIIVLSEIDSITSSLQILGRAMRGIKNGGNASNTVYLTKNNKNTLENYGLLEYKALN